MFMNSVPNSDSEQCTESRLGWVHRVHTLNPGWAPTARWAGLIVAHQAPCRGRVAAHPRPYCSHVAARYVTALLPSPPVTIQFLYSDPSPLPRAPSALLRMHSVVLRAHAVVSQRLSFVSRPKVAPLSHDTNFCIATHS